MGNKEESKYESHIYQKASKQTIGKESTKTFQNTTIIFCGSYQENSFVVIFLINNDVVFFVHL